MGTAKLLAEVGRMGAHVPLFALSNQDAALRCSLLLVSFAFFIAIMYTHEMSTFVTMLKLIPFPIQVHLFTYPLSFLCQIALVIVSIEILSSPRPTHPQFPLFLSEIILTRLLSWH
jgi:hypothetical protein